MPDQLLLQSSFSQPPMKSKRRLSKINSQFKSSTAAFLQRNAQILGCHDQTKETSGFDDALKVSAVQSSSPQVAIRGA